MKSRILAVCAAIAIMAGSAAAQTKATVNVVLFAGGSAMPIYVAQQKGFFEREGLVVNVRATPSSGYQMSNLIAGNFDIAGTAIDNLIAYMEGMGTAKITRTPDLVTIFGGSSTELALMAQKNIKSYADLRGKEFALDSLSTGFAFVLRAALEKNGLKPTDYKFVPFGGTRERVAALRDGKAAAALVNEPFSTVLRAAGFSDLGDTVSAVGKYQAGVQIANRDWAAKNEKTVVAYIRALLSAIDWIYNPANTDEAVRILAAHVRIPEAAARNTVVRLTKGQAALARKGEIDLEGVKNVLALREKYGQPQKKMGPPEKYLELRYYNQAVGK